jgi:hypothetical protein
MISNTNQKLVIGNSFTENNNLLESSNKNFLRQFQAIIYLNQANIT